MAIPVANATCKASELDVTGGKIKYSTSAVIKPDSELVGTCHKRPIPLFATNPTVTIIPSEASSDPIL